MSVLPDHARPLAADAVFRFHCHSGVSCFTECCRELELALSPYDAVRLQQALAISSYNFMERYAIIEFGPDDLHPKVYLAMIDDGRATCPFVSASGCKVYDDRPCACRTYPVGRGASLDHNEQAQEQFVIIKEAHCLGFAENRTQTVHEWQDEQQTKEYNRCNDLFMTLLPRDRSQAIQRLSDDEAGLFIDTLYHLDRFKTKFPTDGADSELPDDVPALLLSATNWLKEQWQAAR